VPQVRVRSLDANLGNSCVARAPLRVLCVGVGTSLDAHSRVRLWAHHLGMLHRAFILSAVRRSRTQLKAPLRPRRISGSPGILLHEPPDLEPPTTTFLHFLCPRCGKFSRHTKERNAPLATYPSKQAIMRAPENTSSSPPSSPLCPNLLCHKHHCTKHVELTIPPPASRFTTPSTFF
jgi:hypothetical protein